MGSQNKINRSNIKINLNKIMKKIVKFINIFLRTILVGSFRQERIAEEILKILIKFSEKDKELKILDYGSGFFKPSLADLISKKAKDKNLKIKFTCFDFYNKRQLKTLNKDSNIKYQNLLKFKKNKNKFDFCIISDTLHHIKSGVNDIKYLSEIMVYLKKNIKLFIIKDHYASNLFQQLLLQILDFFGNYQNDTNIPKKYFDRELFKIFIKKAKLKEIYKVTDKKYYNWFLIFFNNSNLHFISVLKKNDS